MQMLDALKDFLNLPETIECLREENRRLRSDLDDLVIRLNEDYSTTDEVDDRIRNELSDYDPVLDYSDIADNVMDELDYERIADDVKDRLDEYVSDEEFCCLKDRVCELESKDDTESRMEVCEKRMKEIRDGLDKSMEFAEKFVALYREYREKYG